MNIVLDRLKEISSAVLYAAEGTDLEMVLLRIAKVAKELANTHYAALGVPDGKGGLAHFKTVGLTPEQESRIPHRPRGEGLIGAIMRERRTIRLEDMQADERSSGFPDNHPPMTSFLGVPIMASRQLFGMLYLSDKVDGTPFTDEDQLLVETLAGYAALAIAGAVIQEQQARVRLLEERERIGMELHDGVIQSLFGIGMKVDLLRRKNGTTTPEDMLSIIHDLNDVIEDIRHYITDLRNRDTQQYTIYECLVQLKDRLHPPDNITFDITAPDMMPPFTPAVFESVCLVVNEAMSNAIRHSQADFIKVEAFIEKGRYVMVVNDNGSGFDVDHALQQTGLGLRNMQQRARLYGGRVSIESAPGDGTQVTIVIPIRAY